MNNKETLKSYNNRLNTNNITLDNIIETIDTLPEAKEVVLQDKTIEITENGTQTIKADSGYDGLNEVEVITNVASSGGGGTTEKGLIINQYSDNGFPTDVTLKNVSLSSSYMYLFGTASTTSNYYNTLSGIIAELKKLTVDGVTFTSKKIPNSFCQGAYYLEEAYFKNCTSATSLGGSVFYNCANLKKVELPDKITQITSSCFFGCTSLETFNFTNYTSIGQDAFYNCTNLILNELPDEIKTISTRAFYKCSKVNIKKIPSNVTQILASTFYTTGTTQVSMANVTKIAGTSSTTGAFGNCTSLKTVWIGSAIATIDNYVFYNDTNLTKIFIDLPRTTVEAMGNYSSAFSNGTLTTDIIICNDDEGFMTKEQFDAIDWSTQ